MLGTTAIGLTEKCPSDPVMAVGTQHSIIHTSGKTKVTQHTERIVGFRRMIQRRVDRPTDQHTGLFFNFHSAFLAAGRPTLTRNVARELIDAPLRQ